MARSSRRWLSFLAWASGLGLALLLAGVLLTQSSWFERWLTRAVEAAIELGTGEDAVLGGLEVDPWTGRIELDGLILTHRSDDPAQAGGVILAVESVTAWIGLREHHPIARRLEIVRPVLRLHLDEDGLREFRDTATSGGKTTELPWDQLWIRDGSFRLDHGDDTVQIAGLSLSPDAQVAGRVTVRMDELMFRVGAVEQSAHDITFGRVWMTPDRLLFPELRLNFPDLRVNGDLAMIVGGPVSGDLSAKASLGAFNPLMPSHLQLGGMAWVDADLDGTLAAPKVKGALSVEDGVLVRHGRDGALVPTQIGDFSTGWSWRDGLLVIEDMRLSVGGGTASVSGTIAPASSGIYLSVTGEGMRFAPTMKQAGGPPAAWVDFLADAELQVAGTLRPLHLNGSFDIASRDFRVTAGPAMDPESSTMLALPVLRTAGEIRLGDGQARLIGRHTETRRSHGNIDATMDIAAQSLDLSVDLPRLDLRDLAPLGDLGLAGRGHLVGRLWGPFEDLQAAGRMDVRELRVFDAPYADRAQVRFELPEMKLLRFPEFHAWRGESRYSGRLEIAFQDPMQMDLQIMLQQARIADVSGIFLDIPGLDGDMEGMLSIQGPPHALDGEANFALHDVALFGERFDTGHLDATMDAGRFTLDSLELSRADGRESLLSRGTIGAGWAMDMEVLSGGLRLEHSDIIARQGWPLRGLVTLDSRVVGTLFEPRPFGRLTVRNTWFSNKPVPDTTLYLDTHNGVLDVTGGVAGNGLGVDGSFGLWGKHPYRLLADLDEFPLHTFYPQAADGEPLRAVVSGRLQAAGDLAGEPLQLDAQADRVEVGWAGHRLTNTEPWRWTQRGSAFKLSGLTLDGGDTRLSFHGGRGEDGRLQMGGGGSLDLDLGRIVLSDLERAEGVAQIDVQMTGERGQVHPRLGLSLDGATIQGSWVPEPFEEVRASVVADADGYRIEQASGRLGGGSWNAGGSISAHDWRPTRYDLTADLSDARVRYLSFLPPLVGDAHFSFDGPVGDLLLSGEVDIADMLFADRIDWESWLLEVSGGRLSAAAEEERENLFDLDIQIDADKSVRMRNNVADLVASADLRVVGDTARPGIVGDVRAVPGGRVYVKEREFELSRGELHFIEPFSFDPDLDIAMATDVRSRDQQYHVDYQVSGLYSDWRTNTSSSPALPQADINALLLFGMTREELERYGGLTGALAMEGTDLVASRLGLIDKSRITTLIQPDRIDLITGSTARGSDTITSDLRLLIEKDMGTDDRVIIEQKIGVSGSYLGWEHQLVRQLYSRTYWTNEQLGRQLESGAWGTEFNFRWELQ